LIKSLFVKIGLNLERRRRRKRAEVCQ